MVWIAVLISLLWPCPAAPPVDGSSGVIPYANPYHLGMDFLTPFGTPVVSPVPGTVTFAGDVALNRAVTVEPYEGVKVTVSYLSEIEVREGDFVETGDVLGQSGYAHHSIPAVHLSLRFLGEYVDPNLLFRCSVRRSGVRLVESGG